VVRVLIFSRARRPILTSDGLGDMTGTSEYRCCIGTPDIQRHFGASKGGYTFTYSSLMEFSDRKKWQTGVSSSLSHQYQ
jgi:hypothetical protein